MKKISLSISFMLLFVLIIKAQAPTKKDRIQYLFNLMHQDSMISKMSAGMATIWTKSMRNNGEDSENGLSKKDSIDKVNKKAESMNVYMKSIMKLLNDDMVNSYDQHFTSAEIEDFIVFYSSKSGQKMLQETPNITKELFENMTSEKYQSKVREFAEKEAQAQ